MKTYKCKHKVVDNYWQVGIFYKTRETDDN